MASSNGPAPAKGPLGLLPLGPLRLLLRSLLAQLFTGSQDRARSEATGQASASPTMRNKEEWEVHYRDDGSIGGLVIHRSVHEDDAGPRTELG